jgi:hypothetical protein
VRSRFESRFGSLLAAVAFLAFSTTAPIAHLHLSDEASLHHPRHADATLYHAHFHHEPAKSTSGGLEGDAPVHGETLSAAVVEPLQKFSFEPIAISSPAVDITAHLATRVAQKAQPRAEEALPHGPPLICSQPLRAPPA